MGIDRVSGLEGKSRKMDEKRGEREKRRHGDGKVDTRKSWNEKMKKGQRRERKGRRETAT